ncbi:uncharacterized protein LOC126984858 isoform X20 [Eriocheir sinensis]|uniref:uncharacterized protein LOC126984858 isoform X20 n=1 Tax=Eriocheir sinensis TaxID=95602 RepID=UPI0021C822FD|nr:uncharacterized protein LOC126984858 isoform X20 [Eriocheir sinensis]
MSGQDKQEQTAAGGRRKDKQDPDGDIIMRLEYGLLNSSSLELIERVKQFANLVLALMMLFARYNHWMVGDKFERLAPSLPRSHPLQPPKGRTEEQPPTPSLAAPRLLSSPPPPPPLSTWTVEKGCLVWRCLIGVCGLVFIISFVCVCVCVCVLPFPPSLAPMFVSRCL